MIRYDVTMDWDSVPRVLYVNAPSTEISVQDAYDTAKYLETTVQGIDEYPLCDCAGTEDLGGGVAVGLTLTWYNTLIAFEARPGPDWVICKLTGGNMVAKDGYNGAGTPIDVRYPTAYTTVDRASSSSATTQGIDAIAFMSFNNEVWHDVAGNTFVEHALLGRDPNLLGNTQYPAADRNEAVAIARNKNITQLRTTGVHEFSTATDISGFRLHGDSAVNDIMVIDSAPDVTNVSIRDLTISGTLDGGTTLRDCLVSGLNFFNGIFHQCAFNTSPVYLGGGIGVTAMFLSCYSAVPGGNARPCIDFDNTETNLDVRGWLGGLELKNKTTANGEVSLDMSSGTLYIRSSCTAGEITVRGIGRCVDESGPGCNVITTGLIDPSVVNPDITAAAVWSYER